VQVGSSAQSVTYHSTPEDQLATKDPILGQIIAGSPARWPIEPTENPLWGLLRIVMAQQVSTLVACRIAARASSAYPCLLTPSPLEVPASSKFRALGLSQRRAQCCTDIVQRSLEILTKIENGFTWDDALEGFKGIGPWTISVFKIMVLRDPDVLPLGDVGLERAIRRVYGGAQNVEQLSEKWRPFRSVACWYLWRTLGNEQLG
jgi:DNA-3-methyladenine glycosylase II